MKVSIVCAYNNQLDMTKDFLDNMQRTLQGFPGEIYLILVNGGNKTDIQHPFINELVHLDQNIGFSVTINAGLRRVPNDSDYVFLVGNDSFPIENGWLESLIELQKKTSAWIVNPMNDRPGIEALSHKHLKEYDDYIEVWMYPSIAYLMTKECFDKIGYWDEGFVRTGMYGDDDYCRRVILSGGKIVLSKKVLLRHLLSQECNTLGTVNMDMEVNLNYYKKKWGLNR